MPASSVGKQKGCPYVLLSVEPTATPSQIRKAYHKMALKVHPDKNPSEEAVASFQALQKAYAILSNPEKRRCARVGALPPRQSFSHRKLSGPRGAGGMTGPAAPTRTRRALTTPTRTTAASTL